MFNTDRRHLEECIASVLVQTFTDWELLLVDDASSARHIGKVLDKATDLDGRIFSLRRDSNGGIVAASNEGLSLARGEFVMLLDHDDVLEPDALESVDAVLLADETIDYVYTDESLISADGSFVDAFHKPDWSPERFLHQMYVCHLSTIRRSLVLEVGGFRHGFDGAQDFDLVFRVVEKARHIAHVPRVLYHWRMAKTSVSSSSEAKPYAYESGRRAIESHLQRVGREGNVTQSVSHPGTYRITDRLLGNPTASLLVPTSNSSDMVWGVMRNHRTETVEKLIKDPQLGVEIRCVDGAEGVAKAFNSARKDSTADILVFSSPSLEPMGAGWARDLVQPLADPGIGVVSGVTYTANSRLEHAGFYLSGSFVERAHFRRALNDRGIRAVLETVFEVSAADWQCLAVKHSLFDELGGFDEDLAHPWVVIDFCLRAAANGQRTVVNPEASFFEFSNNDDFAPRRVRAPRAFREKWAEVFAHDPYRPARPLLKSEEAARPKWRPMSLRHVAKLRRSP